MLNDYRDLEGKFNKIVSIGMFEHVGLGHLPEYFYKIQELLKDGGLALNHGITSTDPDNGETPYGGGEGMLIKADILHAAWSAVVPEKKPSVRTIMMSPQGPRFDAAKAKEELVAPPAAPPAAPPTTGKRKPETSKRKT